MFIWRQKTNFMLHVFLEILQSCYFKYFEHTCLRKSLPAGKNQLHPLCFSEDIAKICKLLILGTLGMPGYVNPKIPKICIPKINFIIHLFLEILYPMTREPEFWQILDWWWNINNNISFHLWSCPGKTKKTIFQKI